MANEAIKVELYGANNDGSPRRYTCASGAGISKGTLLTLSDPRTAAAQTASTAMLAGIAAMDKDGSDYSTSISAWTNGVFTMYADGTITTGDPVKSGTTANRVATSLGEADPVASGAQILGYALETAADGETLSIRVEM